MDARFFSNISRLYGEVGRSILAGNVMFGRLTISRRFLVVLIIGVATPAFVSVQWLVNTRQALLAERTMEVRHLDEVAWATVSELHQRVVQGLMTEGAAKEAAKQAIRTMRYDNGNYFFIWDLNGTGVAHGGNPALEGRNFISGPDAKRQPGVADMVGKLVHIARTEGEGYARYQIPKAGGTTPLDKIGYSKLFAPWSWAIGTGAYITDIDASFWLNARTHLLFAAVLTLLAALASFMLGRDISQSLQGLTGCMTRLAAGDLDADVPSLERRDEAGVMAASIQVFKEKALLARELEDERDSERRASTDTAALVVRSIGEGLERLAAGDLTFRHTTVLPPAYEKLRLDMNTAVERLQSLVRSISADSTSIRSDTRDISSAASDLSRRTEQQASSLEETAAALDLMTAMVKRTAEDSRRAQDLVSAARGEAHGTTAVVDDAVGTMGQIEQSSRQICETVRLLSDIALQTNMLALNAAVEAARAERTGSFSAIAAEIRGLAQRSAEAAALIKMLSDASQQQVERGVELVSRTGEVLTRIATQVGGIDAVVLNIASSAQEQATGLQLVNAAIAQMKLVTQQNAAFVRQSTAATHGLSSRAEILSDLTSRFRVGQAFSAEQRRA